METAKELKLAVLIDADNISSVHVKAMLEEIAKYGTPTFKRIYGDFTKTTLSGWKGVLLENAITPMQQYGYTTGKNSTDSALIIDAMDILYTGGVDGFCIVSSDSDFTRLAIRLREAGKKVFGIGEKKTPAPFIASCDKFIYIEILHKEVKEVETSTSSKLVTKEVAKKTESILKIDKGFIKVIKDSINDLAEEDGWVFLGLLGHLILKKQPDFDSRNYGFKKLGDLMRNIPGLEVDERPASKNNVIQLYVRVR